MKYINNINIYKILHMFINMIHLKYLLGYQIKKFGTLKINYQLYLDWSHKSSTKVNFLFIYLSFTHKCR
jgi:hypothetical protein